MGEGIGGADIYKLIKQYNGTLELIIMPMMHFPVKFISKISLFTGGRYRINCKNRLKPIKISEQIWTYKYYGMDDQWKGSAQNFIADCWIFENIRCDPGGVTWRRHEWIKCKEDFFYA